MGAEFAADATMEEFLQVRHANQLQVKALSPMRRSVCPRQMLAILRSNFVVQVKTFR